jgi:hypothetical protein
VADWNGDGRKDLLVGYQTAGKVALYLNVGTDVSPVFTSYTNLQAGGVDIVHTSSGCGAPAPFVCDYDGDGMRDLLVGDGNSGYVYFYRNTNTDAAPILAPGVRLMVGSNPLTVTYRATPYLYEWDGDVPVCRGRDVGCPTPPSQIPAGGFPAPGSSSQLALAYADGCVTGHVSSL